MIKMKSGFYYFCHPYSAKTKEGIIANYELCCRRSAKLLLNGYNIYSPVIHSHSIEVSSSVLSQWKQEELWQFWLNVDVAILEHTGFTGLILAPGWGLSKGCKLEYEWFLSHKQPDGKPHEVLQYNKIVGD